MAVDRGAMIAALMKQQHDTLVAATTNNWTTGTGYLATLPATQYPDFTIQYGSTGGSFNMPIQLPTFDGEKPWGLVTIGSNAVQWFATENEAVAQAEIYITADKGLRFVVIRAMNIMEAEPVKTRKTKVG